MCFILIYAQRFCSIYVWGSSVVVTDETAPAAQLEALTAAGTTVWQV
jgi:hypothetical protein